MITQRIVPKREKYQQNLELTSTCTK